MSRKETELETAQRQARELRTRNFDLQYECDASAQMVSMLENRVQELETESEQLRQELAALRRSAVTGRGMGKRIAELTKENYSLECAARLWLQLMEKGLLVSHDDPRR